MSKTNEHKSAKSKSNKKRMETFEKKTILSDRSLGPNCEEGLVNFSAAEHGT